MKNLFVPATFFTGLMVACSGSPRPQLTPAAKQSAPSEKPEATPATPIAQGLEVGTNAPALELPAADGSSFKLADALVNGPVVLAYYRGHW